MDKFELTSKTRVSFSLQKVRGKYKMPIKAWDVIT